MAEARQSTRVSLLEAAGKLFAAKGFRGTTVARICQAAKANIAAVNYHFGSKEELYRQAWRHAHARGLEEFPPDGGIPPDAPPEERLRGRVRALLKRAMAHDGLELQIMGHEMANPSGLLEQVIQDSISPLRQGMQQIVRTLLGGPADDMTVQLCEMSVIGPCMLVIRKQRRAARGGPWPRFEKESLDEMADHFTEFALAGIREIRRKLEHGTYQKQRKVRGPAPRPK